jgi:hypothetical protein
MAGERAHPKGGCLGRCGIHEVWKQITAERIHSAGSTVEH